MAVPRPARRPDPTLGARALGWLRTLPDHRLLDRLIGGRVWIVLLGTLLIGIVTMQLALLRLNAGIGQSVSRGTALEQHNAALRLSISELSDTSRIVALATEMGYVTPPQGSPRFRTASAADAAKALTTMRVPDAAAAAAAAAELAATSVVPATTATDPATATATDPATSASSTTSVQTAPVTTTAPATTAPATTATPTSAAGTTAPTTQTPAAGGASAPQG